MVWFASDNTAPMHPAVLAALSAANAGHAASYGADDITARLNAKALQEVALRYWARGTKAACVGH